MRDFDEMKLARIIVEAGGIDGRTKMQKIVYLLSLMGYELNIDDYIIRQYGPYSRTVACAVDALQASGIIEEHATEQGFQDAWGPVVQYSYSVPDELVSLIEENYHVEVPEGKPPLETAVNDLKGEPRSVLEVAATRLFLEREENLSGEQLDDELLRLKGKLKKDFDRASELVSSLKTKKWI